MRTQTNLTSVNIANLQLACRFWAMAKEQNNSKAAALYYKKAYFILRQEMGAEHNSTLELRKEMREALSKKTTSKATGYERSHC